MLMMDDMVNISIWTDNVHWSYNDVQLQSVSSRFCGHYCVLYCILRSRGVSMRSIVCSFTRDTGFNDVLVHGFICVQ